MGVPMAAGLLIYIWSYLSLKQRALGLHSRSGSNPAPSPEHNLFLQAAHEGVEGISSLVVYLT
jgi:hypothetical protein